MPRDLDGLADVVVLTVKNAFAPVLERLALAEQQHKTLEGRVQELTSLRDRLVTIETKAAEPRHPEPVSVDLGPVLERVAVAEAFLNTLGDVRDRVVTLETKAAVPVPVPVPVPVMESEPVDLAPVLERLSVTEAHLKTFGDVRDRVVALETKAVLPVQTVEPIPVDLGPVLERVAVAEVRLTELDKYAARIEGYTSFLQRDAAALSERLAVMETKPSLPGPPGEPGPPGKDGVNGKDGSAGLSFEGVYQEGKSYEPGQLATWGGSSWHCNEPTTTKPGDGSKDWTLMVKRGRDGKDGRDGHDAVMPVVKLAGAR